jgi:hypothetical protein
MLGGGRIPAFKGSPVHDESQRALHVGHLVSLRSPLSDRGDGSWLTILDRLLLKNTGSEVIPGRVKCHNPMKKYPLPDCLHLFIYGL